MKYLLLLAFVLLSGCAFQKLAVGQLDTLIEMQTAGRLDLYRSQKKELGLDIDNFLSRHKPRADELKKLIAQLDPARPEQFPALWKELSEHYRQVANDYSAVLAKYLAQLDVEQRAEFLNKLSNENRQMREKKLEHGEKWLERLEHFFGMVSGAQRQLLRDNSELLKRRWEARLERRLKLQHRLGHIMNGPAFNAEKERQIAGAFSDYQQTSFEGQGDVVQLLQGLCKGLSDEQLRTWRERQSELIELVTVFQQTDYN